VPSKALSVAFWITIVGGGGLAVDSIVRLPVGAALASLVLFLAGAVTVVIVALRDARRRGVGFGVALWQGVRQGLSWVWAFMP
jgi:hypothetical protein